MERFARAPPAAWPSSPLHSARAIANGWPRGPACRRPHGTTTAAHARACRYFSALNYAFQGVLRADLEGRAYNCTDTSDPGVSALGLYPQLLPETPELAPIKTVLLEQRGAGFLDGCIARADVVLEYYGINHSFAQVVRARAARRCRASLLTPSRVAGPPA
jgi:hypothetical protein